MSIDVQHVGAARRPPATAVRRWVRAALEAAGAPVRVSLTVRFVDEAESAALNARHRGKDGPTNVLAFPAAAPAGLPRSLARPLGDVVVCVPRARAEAARFGKTDTERLAHLVVHGVLHLLGEDHHRRGERARMEALERAAAHRLGLADPYQAGTAEAAA